MNLKTKTKKKSLISLVVLFVVSASMLFFTAFASDTFKVKATSGDILTFDSEGCESAIFDTGNGTWGAVGLTKSYDADYTGSTNGAVVVSFTANGGWTAYFGLDLGADYTLSDLPGDIFIRYKTDKQIRGVELYFGGVAGNWLAEPPTTYCDNGWLIMKLPKADIATKLSAAGQSSFSQIGLRWSEDATVAFDWVKIMSVAPAEVHSFGSWIEEVPATCSATGVKAHKDCTLCNKHFDTDGVEITDLTIAIDADAHVYGEWIEEVPATENSTGTKGHYHCSVCDKDFDREGNEITDLSIAQIEKKGGCGSLIDSDVYVLIIVSLMSIVIIPLFTRKKSKR